MSTIIMGMTFEWYQHKAEISVVKWEGICKNLDDNRLVSAPMVW